MEIPFQCHGNRSVKVTGGETSVCSPTQVTLLFLNATIITPHKPSPKSTIFSDQVHCTCCWRCGSYKNSLYCGWNVTGPCWDSFSSSPFFRCCLLCSCCVYNYILVVPNERSVTSLMFQCHTALTVSGRYQTSTHRSLFRFFQVPRCAVKGNFGPNWQP